MKIPDSFPLQATGPALPNPPERPSIYQPRRHRVLRAASAICLTGAMGCALGEVGVPQTEAYSGPALIVKEGASAVGELGGDQCGVVSKESTSLLPGKETRSTEGYQWFSIPADSVSFRGIPAEDCPNTVWVADHDTRPA